MLSPSSRNDMDGQQPACHHVEERELDVPQPAMCTLCRLKGDRWVDLFQCMTCGWVACSNDSYNRHARAHFEETDHPVARSLRPGSTLKWCYVDRRAV
jgi:uncharacterized UBP type Zn finger protein